MKVAVFIFSFLCFTVLNAQNLYPLHPSVGDTIDVNEKLDYSLFDSIPNKDFVRATISFEEDGFYLSVLKTKNSLKEDTTFLNVEKHLLKQEEIIKEQRKIQTINAYYVYVAEEAKKPKKEPIKTVQKLKPLRLEGPMAEQMKKEARMKTRLKAERRMNTEFEMGLRPRTLFLEIR